MCTISTRIALVNGLDSSHTHTPLSRTAASIRVTDNHRVILAPHHPGTFAIRRFCDFLLEIWATDAIAVINCKKATKNEHYLTYYNERACACERFWCRK